MKYNKEQAQTYMENIFGVLGDKLLNPDSIYAGRNGHLRFAREIGYALNDFDEEGRNEIIHVSYGLIYVKGCLLNPILDAKEWISEMKSQIKI